MYIYTIFKYLTFLFHGLKNNFTHWQEISTGEHTDKGIQLIDVFEIGLYNFFWCRPI